LLFCLKDLRYGSGVLKSHGLIKSLYRGFELSGFKSFVSIKEGWIRGYVYEFLENQYQVSWSPDPDRKLVFRKKPWILMPTQGFSATLHNRNLANPMLIGLNGDMVNVSKKKK
jgi:hypothetical protein